ncbi:MAG: type II toxin-antitoxin system death-on-curing family toxin [Shimia sp.]
MTQPLLTLSDAIKAHDAALEYGGRAGVVNLGSIESALARPFCGYFPTMAEKAAALLHAVVANHGFVDGNKRTALILTETLIERGGYVLTLPEDERFDDLIVAVAVGEITLSDLTHWFAARLSKA